MRLVVDANILFAALIKASITSALLFDQNIQLFAPEYLLEEFCKHKQTIIKKTNRTATELAEIFQILQARITVVPKQEFSHFLNKAKFISPDKDDTVYFALALRLKCGIWSNDKQLKKQEHIKVYSTADLIGLL
ncbi:MAG: PIN domain-containing protein [Candidatus Woesearchaeota archaeon]